MIAMKKYMKTSLLGIGVFLLSFSSCSHQLNDSLLSNAEWESFLSQHDMFWTHLSADPVQPTYDFSLKQGYYAGALMGNGLLGTNMYKLKDNVYRLNIGRSDVTETRKPYSLFNSARLPIGYFTLSTVGDVVKEQMRLSLYDAVTRGYLVTDKGKIDFSTYVHALHDYVVFETQSSGDEVDYKWDFVAQKAISPRQILHHNAPDDYLNCKGESNPMAKKIRRGETHFVIQPLVSDSSMSQINKVYVVAWRTMRHDDKRRIVATVAQENDERLAIDVAGRTLDAACGEKSTALLSTHQRWWHDFYHRAAFLSFPDPRMESFYWAQYYKFASTTRPGKPIVDLQGVWPAWDTPWPAVWINLNLQLTYSWLTKANLGWLELPLWESLYANRHNLIRNVTDVAGQEAWTDAACLGRTSSYDFYSPLNPRLAEQNAYEVGNLTWLLFYYWQYCSAYGDTQQLTGRLFPLLKSAINLYFHIRTEKEGKYGLPPTASPEYVNNNIGPNTNYDLASLRWGLSALIDINRRYGLNDPMETKWQNFLDKLVDYPYDESTGYKVSDACRFENTSHRHYSHLFMIYPYRLVNWGQKENQDKISLSVNHWKGNQGYSRTGKAAMLLSMGEGDRALHEMEVFFDQFLKPNTLYAETGPVFETPMAAVSTLHEFYMQDWGNIIRVFHGIPTSWKDASFVNMRALGGFLVSANRKQGHTVYVSIQNECGHPCQVQTEIPLSRLGVRLVGGKKISYKILDADEGVVEISTKKGERVEMWDKSLPIAKPAPLTRPQGAPLYFGDGSRMQLKKR